MHGSNGHYSHRLVLNQYAGVAAGTPLPGLLQHGWNPDCGAVPDDVAIPKPLPFFCWNARNLQTCQAFGLDHAVAVGAPFLYLPPLANVPTAPERSLLAVPLHSWERARVPQDYARYAEALAAIAKEFQSVTVCLYWFDAQQPEHRQTFEGHGFAVTSIGHRDSNPTFLHDLRHLYLRHSHVTSNRVQTGFFYGLHLGLRGFLLGPPMGTDPRNDPTGEQFDAWQARRYPQLSWELFQGDPSPQLGRDELGAEFVRTPEALRELLRWNPDQRRQLLEAVWDFRVRQAPSLRDRIWAKIRRAWDLSR
jgi:hypothetical protein